jgi:hypothetical protein
MTEIKPQRPTPERERRDDDERRYIAQHAKTGRPRLYETGTPRSKPPITLPTKPFDWRDGR